MEVSGNEKQDRLSRDAQVVGVRESHATVVVDVRHCAPCDDGDLFAVGLVCIADKYRQIRVCSGLLSRSS